MTIPLALYFKTFLSATVGTGIAEKVINSVFNHAGTKPATELDHDLAQFFYPTLGILWGLISSGFDQEEAELLVTSMWAFAPAGFRERPWAN